MLDRDSARRPGLNQNVYVEGQVVKAPRSPRAKPPLSDRVYQVIGSGSSDSEWSALAREIETSTPDLSREAIAKLLRAISERSTAQQEVVIALLGLLERSNS